MCNKLMACLHAARPALALMVLVWAGVVSAAGPVSQPMILAGEIVLSTPKSDVPRSDIEASRQREMAREHRKGRPSSEPELIIVPDEEEGILAPRRGSNNASENASRARAYRQGDTASGAPTTIIVAPDALPAKPASAIEASSQGARSNHARAIEYRNGDHGDHPVSVTGQDGLPTIDCSASGSVAGRIGDDTRSGSVVTLIQGRNQIKARCR